MEDLEMKIRQTILNKQDETTEIRQIMLDKLKEMAEIKFDDCAKGEYPEICSAMNDIAKTMLDDKVNDIAKTLLEK